jgi:signal transduction histidine kinase
MDSSAIGRRALRLGVPARPWLIGLFLLLLLLVLFASVLLTYRQVRGTIEEELGERLLSVACATAAGIDPATMRALRADPEGEAAARLRVFLERVQLDSDVGDLYLFDETRTQLLDVAGRFPAGYANPALDLHYAAATAALTGVPAASELYRVADVYLKTAFAPVLGDSGDVLGALAAEGGASFFRGLWSLQRQVLLTGAAGILAVIALALFFTRQLRRQALAERTLRETSALAAAGELAAILAHEIRNPLAIISSRAERVRAKIAQGREPKEILEWFEAIPQEVARLDAVLTQYLAYARPRDLSGDAATLRPTLDAVLSLLQGDFTRRGIVLERVEELPPEHRVRLAPAALHQVLLNLLLNARDAMPQGGRLRVELTRAGREVRLTVADTGVGMTAEQRKRAFEAFFTTKPGGSGLGLAVVRSMLDLYGARVAVESEPGRGTRFDLWLPSAEGAGGANR